MEIELKYLLRDPEEIDRIFGDPAIQRMKDETEVLPMHAVYFDTEDRKLARERIAFRVRKEGDRYIATLKWSQEQREAGELYRREELNVPVSDEEMIRAPKVSLFDTSPMEDRLKQLAGDEPLTPLMEMTFVRRQTRVDTGDSISELSIDRGDILAGGKTAPILELELELLSGSEEDVMNLGSRLAEKYDLIPGVKSKFERGMDLYGPDQDGPDRDGASPENTEGRASEPGYLVFHR